MELPLSRTLIFNRCLRASCPNCGKEKIHHSWLLIHNKCQSCGMLIKRGNGFYIGPICLNYGIVAFGLICPILITSFAFNVSIYFTLVLSIILSLFCPIIFYPYSWSLWLMIYYLCFPKELYENRHQNSDDLLFDEDERL